jgi:hypothetical protein
VTTIVYLVVTFVVSWAAWIGAAVSAPDGSGPRSLTGTVLFYVGTFAPGVVALAMTAIEAGRDGVRRLIERLLRADVAPRWYVYAIGYMFAIKLVVAAAHRLMFGAWPRFSAEPVALLFAATLLSTIILGQAWLFVSNATRARPTSGHSAHHRP